MSGHVSIQLRKRRHYRLLFNGHADGKFGKKVLEDHGKPQIVFSNTFSIPNLPLFQEIKTGKCLFFKNIYIYKLD